MIHRWLQTTLSRRELLALLTISLLPSSARPAVTNAASRRTSSAPETPAEMILTSFVDQLIPADAQSPAASSLRVDSRLMQQAQKDPLYGKFLRAGCRWMNRQAGGDFVQLPEAIKQQLIGWMESAPANSFPNRFFARIRHDAMSYYYSQPESWRGMGIDHPPQPLGYPDYRARTSEHGEP